MKWLVNTIDHLQMVDAQMRLAKQENSGEKKLSQKIRHVIRPLCPA